MKNFKEFMTDFDDLLVESYENNIMLTEDDEKEIDSKLSEIADSDKLTDEQQKKVEEILSSKFKVTPELIKKIVVFHGKVILWMIKALAFIAKQVENGVINQGINVLDTALLGQCKDALADIFRDQLSKWYSVDELKETYEDMQKDPKFKKGKEYTELDSRSDETKFTDIKEDDAKFQAVWITGDKDNNMLTIIQKFREEAQKNIEKAKAIQDEVVQYVKTNKLGDQISDEDVQKYAIAIHEMIKAKAKPEDIVKQVKSLSTKVSESIDSKITDLEYHNLLIESGSLNESKIILTEDLKNQFVIEALLENEQYVKYLNSFMLTEGIFKSIVDKAKGLKDKTKEVFKNGAKGAVEFLKKPGLQLAIKGVGLGITFALFGLGPVLALAVIKLIQLYGKNLRNIVEEQFTKIKNNRGVIASMDFSLSDDEKKKYSLRYYIADEVWRCANLTNQLKHPSVDFIKACLDSTIGNKFRDYLKSNWSQIFTTKEGEVDPIQILEEKNDELKISENAFKLLKDFKEQYPSIEENCLTSPKIDTRDRSLKDTAKSAVKKEKTVKNK